MRKAVVWLGILLLVGVALALLFVRSGGGGAVPDDAKAAGKTVADFPQTGIPRLRRDGWRSRL